MPPEYHHAASHSSGRGPMVALPAFFTRLPDSCQEVNNVALNVVYVKEPGDSVKALEKEEMKGFQPAGRKPGFDMMTVMRIKG